MSKQSPNGPPGCENLDQMIREGERDASLMEAVARCLGDEVARFARAKLRRRPSSDVEDISQDALLAAQRYLDSFRGDASLRTWLYKLVHLGLLPPPARAQERPRPAQPAGRDLAADAGPTPRQPADQRAARRLQAGHGRPARGGSRACWRRWSGRG